MAFPQTIRWRLLLVVAQLSPVGPLVAFDTFGIAWPSGEIEVVLDLDNADAPDRPPGLFDGSVTWNEVGRASVDDGIDTW